ncbi:MAG: hypothetical protein ABWY36_08640 [Leifsonia sp.]
MNGAPGGHVIVRGRAIERTFAAVAASTLGVAPGDVSVKIADERGVLRVDIRSRCARSAESVVEIAGRTREAVLTEGALLTGSQIGTVRVRITDLIEPKGRKLS